MAEFQLCEKKHTEDQIVEGTVEGIVMFLDEYEAEMFQAICGKVCRQGKIRDFTDSVFYQLPFAFRNRYYSYIDSMYLIG